MKRNNGIDQSSERDGDVEGLCDALKQVPLFSYKVDKYFDDTDQSVYKYDTVYDIYDLPSSINEDDYEDMDSFSIGFTSKFDCVRISIATTDYIRKVSRGEVTKTDTLNYRTLKPEKGGIFCPVIFGPTESNKCSCGKLDDESHVGAKCDRCGVTVGSRTLRRRYIGHVKLNTRVVHPWFHNVACCILDMPKKIYNGIISFDYFVFVRDSIDGKYKFGEVFGAHEYYESLYIYEELCGGGDAIYFLLEAVDLESELSAFNKAVSSKNVSDISDKDLKRRDILHDMIEAQTKPVDLVMELVPIMPADLRPIVSLESGNMATLEANDSYRKLISRNDRLAKFIAAESHPIVTNNERYMVHLVVSQLIGPYKCSTGGRSISELLKGKRGIVRQNALGRRVDYCGRSVIVVDPKLKLDECKIPLTIALEIFKPFLYSYLLLHGYAHSIVEARKLVESRSEAIVRILAEIVKDFPMVLNRAPTLHRLGVQAFNIHLTTDNAIHIPALVCAGFNADFDGDNMACHLPISIPARTECYTLMMSSHNMFLPGNGRLILAPSKDIVMGVYYLTCASSYDQYGEVITTLEEAMQLCIGEVINENQLITFRVKDISGTRDVVTTLGRLRIWHAIVNNYQFSFDVFNKEYDVNVINDIILSVFHANGWVATIDFLNFLTEVGFETITKAGITYGVDDMVVLPDIKEQMERIDDVADSLLQAYRQGLITDEEVDASLLNEWNKLAESTADQLIDEMAARRDISFDSNGIHSNNIYLMYISGARGSKKQAHQVCVFKGLVAMLTGVVSKFVIRSSLYDGLSPAEYFNSTHGERKGLADMAIKTAKAGHLTRRLVDIAHGIYVHEKNCGTDKYLVINVRSDTRQFRINLDDAIFGRVLAEDVYSPAGDCVAKKHDIVDHKLLSVIRQTNVNRVCIYSMAFCMSRNGVCVKCYGTDLATHSLVEIGTPVGIIGAQSVGEPGTQLTMRTHHSGGVAITDTGEVSIYASIDGFVSFTGLVYAVNSNNEKVVMISSYINILDAGNNVLDSIDVVCGVIIVKDDNDEVHAGDIIGYVNTNAKFVISRHTGIVSYRDIVEKISCIVSIDDDTGIKRINVIDQSSDISNLRPRIVVTDDESMEHVYYLEAGMFITVSDGAKVLVGDNIAKSFVLSVKTKDITGGLTRVIDLVEIKKGTNRAILAPVSGICKLSSVGVNKKTRYVTILDKETSKQLCRVSVGCNKHLLVHNNDLIKAGTVIADGDIYLQDMLDIMGFEYTYKYMIGSISSVYIEQGASINYKHLEIILRQMFSYVMVTDIGDSKRLNIGSVYHTNVIRNENVMLANNGLRTVKYKIKIVGITKGALYLCWSFLSSGSFQNTIGVFSQAALRKKVDYLLGSKENVIFCKQIPAGTGFPPFRLYNQSGRYFNGRMHDSGSCGSGSNPDLPV